MMILSAERITGHAQFTKQERILVSGYVQTSDSNLYIIYKSAYPTVYMFYAKLAHFVYLCTFDCTFNSFAYFIQYRGPVNSFATFLCHYAMYSRIFMC